MRVYVIAAVALAIAAALTFTHIEAYRSGRASILQKLADDRITILKDGRKIDEDVLGADDAELCRILGCVLDDGAD